MRTVIAVAWFIVGCSQRSTPEEVETGAFDPKAIVHESDDALRVEVHRRAVPLQDMSIVAETLGGLPMNGLADVSIDLTVPKQGGVPRYREANGTIAASCPTGCTLGDGQAKLAAHGAAFGFGHLAFDKIDGRIDVHGGRVDLSQLEITSQDLALHARLRIDLADTFDAAAIDGCVWFKAGDSLGEREPKTYAVLMTTGATPRADGMFELTVAGTIGQLKLLAKPCEVPATASAARLL